ncbi:MAG: hypothetical protein WDN67_05310 [Candidatus Moraniibacteriota bacterium]
MTLQMSYGATVRFASDPNLYLPAVATRFEGMDVMNYMPLLYVPNAEEVAIIGPGKFVGEGEDWWDRAKDREEEAAEELYKLAEAGVPVNERIFGDPKVMLRPSFLQFYRSKNLYLDGSPPSSMGRCGHSPRLLRRYYDQACPRGNQRSQHGRYRD